MVSLRDFDPSTTVLLKGRRYLARGAVQAAADRPGVYRVTGTGEKPYRVRTDASRDPETGKSRASWIECTCAWGKNQGAGASACSHSVAVLIAVREGLDLPTFTYSTQ